MAGTYILSSEVLDQVFTTNINFHIAVDFILFKDFYQIIKLKLLILVMFILGA